MPTFPSTLPTLSNLPLSREADSRFEIETSRPRQTERPAAGFREVLAGGVSLLMSGAEVATHVVAGPVLAAAVHDARVGAAATLVTTPRPGVTAGQPQTAAVEGMMQKNVQETVQKNVQENVQDGQLSNLQLLALQQHIQQENQRFSTLSNVMRARHDTAKAAVSNIRA
jgi:hypothetical protein